MSKIEILAIIRNKFPNMNSTESKILEEFCLAVEYRLNQVRESFSETQCLKSWEAYKAERLPVYNSLAAHAAKK